jgi:predicted O-methyltransferase YrrM
MDRTEKSARLEQFARKLEARGPDDRDAMVALCEVYWKLKRLDEAVSTYARLLRHEQPAQIDAFDEIYLEALLATGTCPTPARRRERLILLIELLRSTIGIPGEVVECGCFLGLSSYMMCSYLQRWDPSFDGSGYNIFDSFQGLSDPTEDDDIPPDWENAVNLQLMTQRGNFAASLERVERNLHKFPAITFHPGWIPLTFKHLPTANYRFVHVDVDLYDPTLDAFSYFYTKLSPGGVIVSDDYSWPGARRAIDEFCSERGIALQVTATNQAVIRKIPVS